MRIPRAIPLFVVAVSTFFAGLDSVRAQHFDILSQQSNGSVVTGTADFDSNQWRIGVRVFHRDFDSDFAINNPGFNSLGAGSPSMPAGAQALLGATDLSWDFLPMTINGVAQNLFYWNGQDTDGLPGLTSNDVSFGPLPGPNYTLSLFDKSNAKISVAGTNAVVPGGVIDTTALDGAMHRHRFFFLERDSGSGPPPADGLYLVAMRLRMAGLVDSLPILIVFGTPASSVPAEDDAAVPWVEQQLNRTGDYNRNGVVDAADYVTWRNTLNQSGTGLPADGSGNQIVDPADYDVWRMHYGNVSELTVGGGAGVGAFDSMAVPEGNAIGMALVAGGYMMFALSRQSFRFGRAPAKQFACAKMARN
jgi:hypothetical protein